MPYFAALSVFSNASSYSPVKISPDVASSWFLEPLPMLGQRKMSPHLYGIGAIYRTLPGGSLQLKQPNTSYDHLQATPGTDPLIDGNLDPWLAPWNLNPNTCNTSDSTYFGQ